MEKLKLYDILPAHPVEVIMERTFYPAWLEVDLEEKEIHDGMLSGYCTWDGKELKPLDGDCYSADVEIERYEWEEDGSLTYWVRCEWSTPK